MFTYHLTNDRPTEKWSFSQDIGRWPTVILSQEKWSAILTDYPWKRPSLRDVTGRALRFCIDIIIFWIIISANSFKLVKLVI